MRRLIVLLVTVIIVLSCEQGFAEIPPYMQFQGKATDTDGTPLNSTDTDYDLTFRIYESISDEVAIWTETHNDVTIENGVFSVLLGTVEPLNISFNMPYWISTEINGAGEMDRQRIASTGYAYYAQKAEEAGYASIAGGVDELVIENRTSDPLNPQTGRIWFRTDL